MKQFNKKLVSAACFLNCHNDTILNVESLQSRAPSLFASTRCEATTKKRYNHFSTASFIDLMQDNGFTPVNARQQNIRVTRDGVMPNDNPRNGYQRHAIVFRDLNANALGDKEVLPQVIISNSSDGRSSFEVFAGFFRILCNNGLVISESDIQSLKFNHYTPFLTVQNAVKTLFDQFTASYRVIEAMKEKELTNSQIIDFATFAKSLRPVATKLDFNPMELVTPNRYEDQGRDLWHVFNTVQENLINGNVILVNGENHKERKAKVLTSIDASIHANRELWQYASNLAA